MRNPSFIPPATNVLLAVALSSTLAATFGCTTTDAAKKDEAPPPQTSSPAPGAEAPQAPTARPVAPKPIPPRALNRPEPMKLLVLRDAQKPIITFRLVFQTGSIDDPKGKEGLTALAASLMAEGGTKELTSSQLLDALFPMAASIEATTDKELTSFVGRVHQDNVERFFDIFTDVLLEPRLDPKEFDRLRTDMVNNIRNELRGQDDETLGKVALDALLFEGHPYAHYTGGTVLGLGAATLDDVKAHAARVFTQDRLVIGLAGNVSADLEAKVKERLAALPKTGAAPIALPEVRASQGRAWILPKPVLSTAISMGCALPVRRGDADYFPLAVALSYLGEHRQSSGVLFQELREKRGMNYGTYAYPEHFIQEGYGTFARTNIARGQQDFTLWIRPVESPNALFATRGALYFLDRLVRDGISKDGFQQTRGFLLGYTRLWEQTDARRLGYAIDELFYGTPGFLESYRKALETMTAEQVNAAVKRHLGTDKLDFVFVAPEGEALKKLLLSEATGSKAPEASGITYPTPKSEAVLAEDEKIARTRIPVRSVDLKDVSTFMER